MVVAYALSVEVVKDSVPCSFKVEESSSEFELWRNDMVEEIESLYLNDTWELTEFLKGKKASGCKWIFVKKDGSPSDTVR